ncbi:MAG: hypothetical protein U0Z44_06510 [Kouleothrix sp.]
MPTLARGYLTSPNELRRIAALAAAGREPYKTAVKVELGFAADTLKRKPPDVPELININDDIDTPKYISIGAKNAYAWALAYNLLRDRDPARADAYAQAARDWTRYARAPDAHQRLRPQHAPQPVGIYAELRLQRRPAGRLDCAVPASHSPPATTHSC